MFITCEPPLPGRRAIVEELPAVPACCRRLPASSGAGHAHHSDAPCPSLVLPAPFGRPPADTTLIGQGRGGRSRLQQLVDWVGGPAFDGPIVFDEAHTAQNFKPGEKGSTKVAPAVLALQARLPHARVVYASATGVSDVGNLGERAVREGGGRRGRQLSLSPLSDLVATRLPMTAAYMARLGLWGAGSAFPDFERFLDSMKKRGVSFMEM